jgi:hypothetical protein
MRCLRHVACMGEIRNANKLLVEKSEGKKPLGRPRHRWKDNIRLDLRQVGRDDVDLTNLAQERDQLRVVLNAVLNFRVP